jgi:hypothetical protein
MTRKLVALGGAALALLLVSSLWEPAEARRNGGGWQGRSGGGHHLRGGHHFRGGHHSRGGGHHFRHSHRVRPHIFLYSAPFAYGYYGYSDGCSWLRRRALHTGSPYWWDRYYACIYGDVYYDYD